MALSTAWESELFNIVGPDNLIKAPHASYCACNFFSCCSCFLLVMCNPKIGVFFFSLPLLCHLGTAFFSRECFVFEIVDGLREDGAVLFQAIDFPGCVVLTATRFVLCKDHPCIWWVCTCKLGTIRLDLNPVLCEKIIYPNTFTIRRICFQKFKFGLYAWTPNMHADAHRSLRW